MKKMKKKMEKNGKKMKKNEKMKKMKKNLLNKYILSIHQYIKRKKNNNCNSP